MVVVKTTFLYFFLAILVIVSSGASASNWGTYQGVVEARWGDDGRTMTLLSDFAYMSPENKLWLAPVDSVVDGASIPRIFWTDIGGPFAGKYREASVIHDVACEERKEQWEEVHGAFYTAMRASGVKALKAKIMYAAVYHWGPRWEIKKKYENISKSEANEVLDKVVEMSDEDSIVTTEIHELEPGRSGSDVKLDLVVRVIPEEQITPLTEEIYKKLKIEIESKNISLTEIRDMNFK